MRAVLLCMLAGCSGSVSGRWEIITITVGAESVADAGFVDLSGLEADRLGNDHLALLRYPFDPAQGTFTPDPTPETLPVTVNIEAFFDDGDPMRVDYPTTDGSLQQASLIISERNAGELLLEDAAFNGQGMLWLMSRSGSLEPVDPDTGL